MCTSDEIIEEYYSVFKRKRFHKYQDFVSNAELLIATIETKSTMYFPTNKLSILRDKDDNKFLELCSACMADFLVTGNTNDFTMSVYNQTRIVTPRQYWEKYKPAL
ncbi:MAG: putative toxin-antitoxin system toxin component, PIN family [Cyclobacteriaceae bacterium]|nr:putative toxin-antitoxin system toxin component, PIN family [Cyclobacteriaceae bacterium]